MGPSVDCEGPTDYEGLCTMRKAMDCVGLMALMGPMEYKKGHGLYWVHGL